MICILLAVSPQSTPTVQRHFASRLSRASLSPFPIPSPPSNPDKPAVMFTGMLDRKGEKIVKALGGLLVESVYQCTHLVTDKVQQGNVLHCHSLHTLDSTHTISLLSIPCTQSQTFPLFLVFRSFFLLFLPFLLFPPSISHVFFRSVALSSFCAACPEGV